MKDFIKKYYKQFIFIFIILIFDYLFYLKPIISIDTENFINDRTSLLTSWIGINRFSLVLLKNIFFIPFNILVTRFLTIIFFYLSLISYSYLFTTWLKKDNKYLIYIISLIIGLSPILAEQFSFTLQSLEISIGFLLLSIIFNLIDKFLNSSNKRLLILIIPFLSFVFGLYQAFVPLFISLCCFYLLTHKKGFKELISILIVSISLYYLTGFIFKNFIYHYTSNYLTNNFNWYNKSFIHNILVIGYIGISSILGLSIYHLSSYLIIFILGLTALIKKKKNLFLFFCLAISPFLLNILTASSIAYQAQFNYIFSLTLMLIYLLNILSNKKLINILYVISIAIIIREGLITFNLFYHDNIRYLSDVKLTSSIAKEIPTNSCLEFIGSLDEKIKFKGETLGNSFYNWDNNGPLGSNIRINGLMKSLNYNYNMPTLEYYNSTKNLDIKEIEKINECYIVNLNNIKKD